ncbi:MAG: DegV family protein [Anaerolineae bacterium]
MSTIAMVTDSTSDLPHDWVAQRQITVVPVYVRFGDEVYRDGVDMDSATFYRRLRTTRELPRTSQPSVGDFLDVYRRLLDTADAVISIHISRGLSGTIAAAEAAKQQLADSLGQEPPIHIVDSRVASAATALVVSAASDCIAAGQSVAQTLATLGNVIEHMFVVFAVDTLEFLHKNGRIGSAAALVGSALHVRPILTFRDGIVAVRERVRTTTRARERLLELVVEAAHGRPIRAGICHADAPAEAEKIRRYLVENLDCREALVVEFGPVVGSHGGPGTVGVGFYPVS